MYQNWNYNLDGCCTAVNSSTTTTIGNVYTSSICAIPNEIFLSCNDPTKIVREEMQKVDEHVDQLEVDIEFLNEERKKQQETINNLCSKLVDAVETINKLNTEIENLKGYTDYLNELIEILKNKDKQEEQNECLPF